MAEPDASDPTQALHGWRPPAPAPFELQLRSTLRAGVAAPVDLHLERVVAEPPAFDPTHALDGWHAPAPAEPDLQLRSLRRVALDDGKLARLKARGYEMVEVEDVEIVESRPAAPVADPVTAPVALAATAEPPPVAPPDLPTAVAAMEPGPASEPADEATPPVGPPATPPVTPEPAPGDAPAAAAAPDPATDAAPPVLDFQPLPRPVDDAQQLLADIRLPEVPPPAVEQPAQVLDFSLPPSAPADPAELLRQIELPEVAPPAAAEAPLLDLPIRPAPPVPNPRVLAAWQPRAWLGLLRCVAEGRTAVVQTPDGPQVRQQPPCWLCALWPPQPTDAALLGRWPELAGIVAADSSAAAAQALLAELPPGAELWPAAALDADWALIADLVLSQDGGLEPAEVAVLRDVAEAERLTSRRRAGDGYRLQGRVARRNP